MQTVRLMEIAGEDGVLHLRIPVSRPAAQYEAVVVLAPNESNAPVSTPEERGWPPGYFDLAGSIGDETFVRPPQGEYEQRLAFE